MTQSAGYNQVAPRPALGQSQSFLMVAKDKTITLKNDHEITLSGDGKITIKTQGGIQFVLDDNGGSASLTATSVSISAGSVEFKKA